MRIASAVGITPIGATTPGGAPTWLTRPGPAAPAGSGFPPPLGADATQGDPVSPTAAALVVALSNPAHAIGHVIGLRDDGGASMDTLKVVDRPGGGWLGVYHSWVDGVFRARVARSDDMLNWTRVRELGTHASQATIAYGPAGQVIVAWETDSRRGNHISIREFASVEDLEHGAPVATFEAPRRLGHNEGTPNIYSVTEDAEGRTELHMGLHYLNDLGVDRQAQVRLVGYRDWAPQVLDDTNRFFEREGTGGNLGDRDGFEVDGRPFSVIEAQQVRNDFGTWRFGLVDHEQQRMTWIPVSTPGGSASMGNPTVSVVTLPDGTQGLVATSFIFTEGSAPGEPGTMLSFFRLDAPR